MAKWKRTRNDLDVLARVKDDLCQIIIQGEWARVGIYQFLNRLLVIFQQPTVISVFKQAQPRYNPKFMLTTFSDKVNGTYYQHYLDSLTDRDIKQQLIPIYDTKYKLLVHKIDRNEEYIFKPGEALTFTKYPEDHSCLNILRCLLESENDKEEKKKDVFFRHLNANSYWQEQLDQTFSHPNSEPESKQAFQYQDTDSLVLGCSTEDYFSGILQAPFYDFSHSPLIKGKEANRPANVCYFIRTYDKPLNRFKGSYDYHVRMAIPFTQREPFKAALKIIRLTLNHTKVKWQFDGKGKYFDHYYDQSYIDLLKGFIDTKGYDHLIGLLQKPYGQYSRCFVDPVLTSGFLDIRRNPLRTKYGLDRIDDQHENDDHEEVRDDKIRTTALFYLFTIMKPDIYKENRRVACLSKPLRVSTSPFLCMVTFTEFHNEEKEDYLNWQIYHRFYHDIGIPMGRRIRSALQDDYREKIKAIVHHVLQEVYEEVVSKQSKAFNINSVTQELNRCFYSLSRLLPFHLVQFSHSRGIEKDSLYYVELGGSPVYCLKFSLSSNPHFPSLMESGIYRKEEKVKAAIQSGVLTFFMDLRKASNQSGNHEDQRKKEN